MTRLTFQQVTLDVKPVDIGCMLMQLADEAYPMAHAAGMTVRLSVQSEPMMVSADPDKLARALQNLLRNAVFLWPKGRNSDLCASGRESVCPFCFQSWAGPAGGAGPLF